MVLLAAWKLSAGPISLAFLNGYFEEALNRVHPGVEVRLDDTVLTWAGWDRTLDIRIVNLRGVAPDGRMIAAIPEMSVSLSARALLRGMAAPKAIELFRPRLRLVRRMDGLLEVGFGDGEDAAGKTISELLAELMAEPDPDDPLSYLAHINVVDGEMRMEDRGLGLAWIAPKAILALERDPAGIRGKASLSVQIEEGSMASVEVNGSYRAANAGFDVDVAFSGVTPSAFTHVTPVFDPLKALNLPFKGKLTASGKGGGEIAKVGFEISGAAGTLVLPEPLAQELPVASLEVTGAYLGTSGTVAVDSLALDLGDGGRVHIPAPTDHWMPLRGVRAEGIYRIESGRLEIPTLDLNLAGPTASLSLVAEGVGGRNLSVDVDGKLRTLRIDDFIRYWPAAWGRDAHRWCTTHLSDGMVRETRAKVRLRSDGKGGLALDTLGGDMDIEDITVDYLPPMPKVRHTMARATFDTKRFDIFVTRGEALGLAVKKGTIFLTGLDVRDQYADIDLHVVGPLRNALELVDSKPLGYASRLGIKPASTSGQAATDLHLYFILENDLTLDRIDVSASAAIEDALLKKMVFDQDVADGRLNLRVDKKGLDVTGKAAVDGTPLSLAWRENFDDKTAFRSRYEMEGMVADVTRLDAIGLPVSAFPGGTLKGGMGFHLAHQIAHSRKGTLEIRADLAPLEADFTELGWKKGTGVPASLRAEMTMADNALAAITSLSVTGGGLEAKARAKFAAGGGGLERIDLDHLAFGHTDIKGTIVPKRGRDWQVILQGPALNLTPVWSERSSAGKEAAAPDPAAPIVTIVVDLDRVWLDTSAGAKLERVSGTLARQGPLLRSAELRGVVGESKSLEIRIDPVGGNKRRLDLRSEDAGAALRSLGFYDHMVGGGLEIRGEFDDAQAGQPLTGEVLARDYRIIKAPTLAHVVSLLALTGIVESIQGEGLKFSELKLPFTLRGGILELRDGKAWGPSLGFTAKGSYDTVGETMKMEGTIVPAYSINAVLGNIPVLGNIFTGGEEGSGVFAATYSMTGSGEKPEISVNPLSALAPGFLRNLFNIFEAENEKEGPAGKAPDPERAALPPGPPER